MRHVNPVKTHPERITQKDEELVNDLEYKKIKFLASKEHFNRIDTKNNICINVFCYENKLTFPMYISDQKFELSMDLLLLIDKNKLYYVYIKDFDRFIFHKSKKKQKSTFAKAVYTALVVKMF